MQLAMLWSDYLIYGLVILMIAVAIWISRYPHWRTPWRQVLQRRLGAAAAVILLFYATIGLLDSIHVRATNTQGAVNTESVLDLLVAPLGQQLEKSYSAPFSNHLFTQSQTHDYPPLQYVTAKPADVFRYMAWSLLLGAISFLIMSALVYFFWFYRREKTRQSLIAWPTIGITFLIGWLLIWLCVILSMHYHILGTDKVGRDVFYLTIKSIRTGLLIGTLTTVFTLPFALFLGTIAGYFRGWIDDVIQYLYTTLSSIPGVLLISASVLMLQVYMAKHAADYATLMERADVRLLALCFILAITGWASLCRFLRGETLKLRELEFVQAGRALGSSQLSIITRHIFPNVFHIVIITLVLDFSGLVLAEAVLSYVGVGVDPTTISWGNMINSSRLELSREPIVWWPLLAAMVAMFGLVLAANIFADAVRDAFDPHLRTPSC